MRQWRVAFRIVGIRPLPRRGVGPINDIVRVGWGGVTCSILRSSKQIW